MALPHYHNNIHNTLTRQYKQYQFVNIKNSDEVYILKYYDYRVSQREYFWHVWKITPEGYIIDIHYFLMESEISEVKDTLIEIDIEHIRNKQSSIEISNNKSSFYTDFINYYEQLKVDYFLNNI